MYKIAVLLIFFLLNINCSSGQNAFKIELGKEISIRETNTIKLYRINSQKWCDQSKAVSVIYLNNISSCFDYLKTINTQDSKAIIRLLRNHSTYGNEDVACFDTEYALIIFDKKNVIIGYVNISVSCNKLISSPKILEREFYSRDDLHNVGFSIKGRNELLRLLKMNDLTLIW